MTLMDKIHGEIQDIGIGKSSYREPSLITGHGNDGYTWEVSIPQGANYDAKKVNYNEILGFESIQKYGEYENNSYTNMVTSVDSYGGFYVGRYETTKDTGENNNIIVGSKANSNILSETNWYRLNLYQDSVINSSNPYNNIQSVTSNMMYGSQWDAMLNYILKGNNRDKVTTAKWVPQTNNIAQSKQNEKDVVNNIYDLAGNTYEWTKEANGTQYRTFRGGSYDSTTSGTLSSRINNVPTDQGPILGTRLSLYIQSTNDMTGPVATIEKISATTNTITVQANATDKETGVSKYIYSISIDGNTWDKIAEMESNSYTYTGLKQQTTYYVKVQARDGAGNIGKEAIQTQTTGSLAEDMATNGITEKQIYGTNGNGVIQLELAKTYTDSGFYIQYKVLDSSDTDPEALEWKTGDVIERLSNGQRIYATVFDGINRSTDTKIIDVSELEEYAYIDNSGNTYTEEEATTDANKGKTTYDTTIAYTDDEGNKAYIPAGFKIGSTNTVNNINNGLVVQDGNGNEYVWIPVPDVIETDTSATSAEKAMAKYQTDSNQYYEGIFYNFKGIQSTKINTKIGTNGNREPSIVTGGLEYTWNLKENTALGKSYDTQEQYYKRMSFRTADEVSAFVSYSEMGRYINAEYTNMVKSVNTYGGFYVGRYELSLTDVNTNSHAVAQSQIGKMPQNNINWYKAYYYQDSKINPNNFYYNSKSIVSSMIWDSQWDAIMNWMLQDDDTKEFVTKVTGNHTDVVDETGSHGDDVAKNIMDLASNVAEWTQGAEGTSFRNYRGGYAVFTNDNIAGKASASSKINQYRAPNMTAVYKQSADSTGSSQVSMLGSRTALYIKNTEDTTPPEIEIKNTAVGTNNIEISVNAEDTETGIDHYKFYLSEYDFKGTEFKESDILQEITSYGSTITFGNLSQNQTYYAKVEAYNGIGEMATCYTTALKTKIVEIVENEITVRFYGKSGEGTGYFEFNNEDLVKEGYYLQHMILSEEETFNEKMWNSEDTETGNKLTGLSEGDIIITRAYDGKNAKEGFYKTSNVTELERFSEIYTQTTIYEDKVESPKEDGSTETIVEGTAYIPAGFKVATSSITKKIASGLVIEDEKGNQYVWIPVENAIYDEKTALAQSGNDSTYKPMARYQSGYNTDSINQYFEGIAYNYIGTRSYVQDINNRVGKSTLYREPSLITNSATNLSWVYNAGDNYDVIQYVDLEPLGINSVAEMGEYMNHDFTQMVQSVAKYGGFYVGRYETSSWETDNWETGGTNKDSTGTIVRSVPNATPMATTNWYKMYLKQDSSYTNNPYKTSTSVKSCMIWGSQYDVMLNYILEGTDQEKVTKIIGNHTGNRSTTGQFGEDILNNIFDLGSNVREWTQEASTSVFRTFRGGFCNVIDSSTASYRSNYGPTNVGANFGSRLSLYLK